MSYYSCSDLIRLMQYPLFKTHSKARLITGRWTPTLLLQSLRIKSFLISSSSLEIFLMAVYIIIFPGLQQEEVLCPLHVSIPIWATAHGPRASVYHQWRHRPLPENERTSGTCHHHYYYRPWNKSGEYILHWHLKKESFYLGVSAWRRKYAFC